MNDNSQTTNSDDFAQALAESLEATEEIRVGDVIEGTILAIHGDVALVDVHGKSEAVLDRDELEELGTGDPVEVVVTSVGDDIRVSRRLAIEQQLKEKLSEAVSTGEPLEGKVVGRRKGGFDVTIAGIRGFCPMSQIEEGRSDDLDRHLGKTYAFKVLEYDPDNRKLVVSRAALMREQRERMRQEAWSKLEPGGEVEGRVRSLTDFGAFVDLGGVDGLVHVTEIAHGHVRHPGDVLHVDDTVQVKVLDLDRAKDRISLSIKALQDNPWDTLEERFPVRGPFQGTVVRTAPFGVFVELEPGIDGLVHVSQLPPGVELDSPEIAAGATINGWVKEIDADNQRIGLTLRRLPDRDPWQAIEMHYQEGQVVEGTVENGADFGVFVELEPGLSALIPASETGLPRDADPKTAFTPGEKVSAKVLSIDPARRRMSLSIRAHKRELERAEYQGHMEAGSDAEPSVTGFGAQLMAALDTADARAKAAKEKTAAAKTTKAKAATKKSAAKTTKAKATTSAEKSPAAKASTKAKPATKAKAAKKTTKAADTKKTTKAKKSAEPNE
jgi:small subunit ribosomal protein S1